MLGGLTVASAGAGSSSWIAGFVLVAIVSDRTVANISLGKGVG
jgi:hypothetical protein